MGSNEKSGQDIRRLKNATSSVKAKEKEPEANKKQRRQLQPGLSGASTFPRRPLQFSVVTKCDRKAVIKYADMSEEMQQDSVECAAQALEKYNIEDTAAHIKKEFDKKYNPTWSCVVRRNFGSYLTHETKHFIYFYLGQVAILLFKSS
nr:dynein light chain 1, cytoplasmic-like [Pan troglodytes]